MAERESAAGPASGIAVVLALAIGFVVVQELPLERYRPGETEKSTFQLLDVQDAESRLWQDPFAAAQRHQDALDKLLNDKYYATSAEEHFRRHTREQLQKRLSDATNKAPLTVIAVSVAGGPYAEDAEQRRRYRYATLAGLNRLNYEPDDSKHVGYVVTRPARLTTAACSEHPDLLPERIPFEWLVGRAGKESQPEVLLLWINEHAITREPLKSLSALIKCLGIDRSKRTIQMKVFGPSTSDTLRRMAAGGETFPKKLGRIEIYSSSATVAERELPPGSLCKPALDTGADTPCVIRTIASDDVVAGALVEELKKRGVFESKGCKPLERRGCDHVAIVSEWDTSYGQNLPGAVEAAIDQHVCGAAKGCAPVVRASYLQGIDGAGTEAPARPSGNGGRRAHGKDETRESSRKEPAEGRQQFDYIRRLAERLKRDNAELLRKNSEIRAIGILGSDVHDKLLVMKALRSEFPAAVFFTTDLDARLLHPEEFTWARNLVVGSSYGLELRDELQESIPPFRDSYQTSLFVATLLAFSKDPLKYEPEALKQRIPPRIFEIGRRSAFALDAPSAARGECTVVDPLGCATLQPPPPPIVPPALRDRLLWVPFVLALAIAAWLYYPRYVQRRAASESDAAVDDDTERCETCPLDSALLSVDRSLRAVAAAFGAAVLVFAVWLYFVGIPLLADNDEPVTFYQGISIWPSELIRVIAGVAAIFLLIRAALRLRRNEVQMTRWFFPEFRAHGMPVVEFSWRDEGVFNRILACDLLNAQPHREKGIEAKIFWRECMFHNLLWPKVIRTVAPAALFGALTAWAMFMWGFPSIPGRGALSKPVDIGVLLFSVPAFLFLTFFVVQATLLTKRFIGALSEHHTLWPEETRRYFGDIVGSPQSRVTAATDQLATEHAKSYDDWIDMRVIAERTALVGKLVYYPLFVLLLLLFARSTLFDKWDWPPGLVLTFALSFTVVVACAVVLRLEAERARKIALAKVRRRLLLAIGGGDAYAPLASQLQFMLEHMSAMRDGAFASVSQQPVVRALLLFVSASGLVFLEYFGIVSL